MGAVVAAAITFVYGSLIGWFVHWVLHQRWSGPLYRAHMNHHIFQYPPDDLVSGVYRTSGTADSTLIFTPAVTLAFFLYAAVLYALGTDAYVIGGTALETLALGILHDSLHTGFHVKKSVWARWEIFAPLRDLHFVHHKRTNRNFGILFFGWDRLFRTFRAAE